MLPGNQFSKCPVLYPDIAASDLNERLAFLSERDFFLVQAIVSTRPELHFHQIRIVLQFNAGPLVAGKRGPHLDRLTRAYGESHRQHGMNQSGESE